MIFSRKIAITATLFLCVLLLCTGLKSEVQTGLTIDAEYQQKALKERSKLSKKAYREYLADPLLEKTTDKHSN